MSDFILGQHEAAIKELLASTARMEKDISEIKTLLAERSGERKVALYVAGAVGAVASTLLGIALKLLTSVIHLRLGA